MNTIQGTLTLVRAGLIPIEDHARNLLGLAVDEMNRAGVTMTAEPDRDLVAVDTDDPDLLPPWVYAAIEANLDTIILWWRSSPSAILVCDECGELRLSGKRPGKDGKRCAMKVKARKPTVSMSNAGPLRPEMGCVTGTQRALDLPWTAKRPNARKVAV